MKKIIGVALLFLVATAPALAGGTTSGGSSSSGGSRMSGGAPRVSQSFSGFGAQPAPRSFVPLTRETPVKSVAEPQRKRTPMPWVSSDRYVDSRPTCSKNPYQQPAMAMNDCAVNPWVLYAFPDDN
jgi:hypothetical protein